MRSTRAFLLLAVFSFEALFPLSSIHLFLFHSFLQNVSRCRGSNPHVKTQVIMHLIYLSFNLVTLIYFILYSVGHKLGPPFPFIDS